MGTVTVTGSASVEVKPDRAVLAVGVQSRRPSAGGAMELVNERAATLVGAMRDTGARDEDLRTTGLSLWFDQSDRSYVASYSLSVGVPSDDAGRFIDAAAEVAGDELTLNGVSFAVADPAAAWRPAARAAVADARAKAEVLAAAAGCTLGADRHHRRGRWRRCRADARGPMRAMAAARRGGHRHAVVAGDGELRADHSVAAEQVGRAGGHRRCETGDLGQDLAWRRSGR